MQYDEIMQATMLLCCYFNKNEVKNFKPLSGLEYSKLAQWLYQNKWSPADLLTKTDEILTEWDDSKGKITAERIKQLLGRGVSMSFALEKWTKQGIWVISRVSEFYPKAIKKHLGEQRPPILFGLGNLQLLNQTGLGFVGSRSISENDALFASDKAIQAVDEGYIVISGGAKGVDQVAMQAALDHGGQSVGILADGIYTNEARRIFLDYLRQGTLVLISPFFPEAGFSVGNAMARNKFIYTMSESVLVVKSDKDKGGTWTGAKENLNKKWVPLLVRDIAEEGNQALIQMGGIGVGPQKVQYAELLSAQPAYKELNAIARIDATTKQPDLLVGNLDMFDTLDETSNLLLENQVDLITKDELKENALNTSSEIDNNPLQVELLPEFYEQTDEYNDESQEVKIHQKYGVIFELFVNTLISLSEDKTSSFSLDDVKNKFPELLDTQIKKWIKELEADGFLRKEGRKARYIFI
ncbi:DNA-processing protein DprA [Acinetobacter baumannii]|uniref:DNA-processing protein DprA n=1 Tax=Acinetobacter baumannii TaxID=470 RepID=UPI002340082F|nr:DNA-processing protein DprA [Acinetobacter baumannii]